MSYPPWKSLLAREGDYCLGPLVGQRSFPAELIRQGSKNPGGGHTEWMRPLLGQGKRGLALLERLGRIAEMPQDQGCMGEAIDPRLHAAVAEHLGLWATVSVNGEGVDGNHF